MTDIVDPATLRPGDVVDMVDTLRVTVADDGCKGNRVSIITTATHESWTMKNPLAGWTRTWHLVSRAEPERGSVWRPQLYDFLYYYEPDARWPDRPWVNTDSGTRYSSPLADMTFVRSAVTS